LLSGRLVIYRDWFGAYVGALGLPELRATAAMVAYY